MLVGHGIVTEDLSRCCLLYTSASATRNEGISLALGQYIQFVDSDDYIEKNMVEALVNRIEETDADMVMCGYTEVFPQDKDVRLPEIDKTITMAELGKEYPNIFEKFLLNSPCLLYTSCSTFFL